MNPAPARSRVAVTTTVALMALAGVAVTGVMLAQRRSASSMMSTRRGSVIPQTARRAAGVTVGELLAGGRVAAFYAGPLLPADLVPALNTLAGEA